MNAKRSAATEAMVQDEVLQHLAWLRLYADTMSENNWRDMQGCLKRQIERLAKACEDAGLARAAWQAG